MSTLTRVLVVLIFIMSLVYMGMSAALFAYRVDYKDQFEKEKIAHKKTEQEKNDEINILKGKIGELNQNVDKLNSNIMTQKQELETARNDLTSWKTTNPELSNNLTALETKYEKLQASLSDAIARNQELNQTNEKLMATKDDAMQARTVLEEKFLNAEDTIIKLEKNLSKIEQQYLTQAKELNQIKSIVEQYKKLAPSLITEGTITKVIEGKVLAISDKAELNIIMISAGKNDGVEVGMKFTVYRADKYVAKIQIEKAEASHSSAFSIKEFQADTIRVNDNVTTSPY